MTMAATLIQASDLSYAQISIAWAANTMATKLGQFIDDCKPVYNDAIEDDRIVRNWLVPMASLHSEMGTTIAYSSQVTFSAVVELSARMTMAAFQRYDDANPKYTRLLAAWNARFGT